MLYKVNQEGNVFDLNPGLYAIPEFAALDDKKVTDSAPEHRDRRMKFVILVADKLSPLRTLPELKRREVAAKYCNYGMEADGRRLNRLGRNIVDGKVEPVEIAITKYRELQWDENQDTLDTISRQIQEIKDYMKSDKKSPVIENGKVARDKADNPIYKIDPKNLKEAIILGEKLPTLIEAKKRVEELLGLKQEVVKLDMPTYTPNDIPEGLEDASMSMLDKVMQKK